MSIKHVLAMRLVAAGTGFVNTHSLGVKERLGGLIAFAPDVGKADYP